MSSGHVLVVVPLDRDGVLPCRASTRMVQPVVVDAADVVEIELDEDERFVLRWGLIDWGGPARCTEEMAVAMGFRNVSDLFAETDRLTAAIRAGAALSRLDWARVLLATEVCFASNVVGSGLDWETTSGLSDAETLVVLRRVQRKLGGIAHVAGRGLGTRPASSTGPA